LLDVCLLVDLDAAVEEDGFSLPRAVGRVVLLIAVVEEELEKEGEL
jgi:hypothetical protein